MDEDERQQHGTCGYESLPAAALTADQVVAWNIRFWRQHAGITQKKLGELMGWTEGNMSAIERSAEEHRDKRRFDAQTIAKLAETLGVPVVAMLLPPDDDGQGRRYVWQDGERARDMRDLMVTVMHYNGEAELTDIYRDRYRGAVTFYVDEQWGAEVGRWFAPMDDKESRLEAAERFRSRQRRLLAMAADDGSVADWLEQDPDEDQP